MEGSLLTKGIFINLYGEKPNISKRKVPRRQFCEWGSVTEILIFYEFDKLDLTERFRSRDSSCPKSKKMREEKSSNGAYYG